MKTTNNTKYNRPMNWQADETAEEYAKRVKKFYEAE